MEQGDDRLSGPSSPVLCLAEDRRNFWPSSAALAVCSSSSIDAAIEGMPTAVTDAVWLGALGRPGRLDGRTGTRTKGGRTTGTPSEIDGKPGGGQQRQAWRIKVSKIWRQWHVWSARVRKLMPQDRMVVRLSPLTADPTRR